MRDSLRRRLQEYSREMLDKQAHRPDKGNGVDFSFSVGNVTYQQKWVRCGRIWCTKCPHGPYWYAVWNQKGRTRSKYIGKHLPGPVREQLDRAIERVSDD